MPISQPSTATVAMLFDPPIPCHECGDPAAWFAAGVSGCKAHCGARCRDDVFIAQEALAAYIAELPRLSKLRAQVAATVPAHRNTSAAARRRPGELAAALTAALPRMREVPPAALGVR